jgi:hypothetical protein
MSREIWPLLLAPDFNIQVRIGSALEPQTQRDFRREVDILSKVQQVLVIPQTVHSLTTLHRCVT